MRSRCLLQPLALAMLPRCDVRNQVDILIPEAFYETAISEQQYKTRHQAVESVTHSPPPVTWGSPCPRVARPVSSRHVPMKVRRLRRHRRRPSRHAPGLRQPLKGRQVSQPGLSQTPKVCDMHLSALETEPQSRPMMPFTCASR